MVKNKTGGSRHKKQARKNVNAPVSKKLRLAKEEGEIYAKVTSIYGNGMAEVLCEDNVRRLLILRRKFMGRNKRDNFIKIDGVLLVGKRSWSVVSGNKKEKVDLLYVYSDGNVEDLKRRVNLPDNILPGCIKEQEESPFDYTNKHNWKNEKTMLGAIPEEKKSVGAKKENKEEVEEPDFDFDDI
jgi:initiation factor 1A